jgi:Nif-specific ferredoxin III
LRQRAQIRLHQAAHARRGRRGCAFDGAKIALHNPSSKWPTSCAVGLAIERATTCLVSPLMEMSHEGFGRALPTGAQWTPTFVQAIDEDRCIGCGRCFRICPRGVLELVGLDEDGQRISLAPDGDEQYEKKVMTIAHQDQCIGCTACARICPKKWFPMLVLKNAGDMKWEKFLYRQPCEQAEILICKSPTCAACPDQPACFGPED